MRLVSVEIEGYRRFFEKQKLQMDCRLVALLGPNEAGKSSILKALQTFNNNKAIPSSGPTSDITRDKSFSENHIVISARYLLEDTDKQFLGTSDLDSIKWLVVEKPISGALKYSFDPPPRRNVEPRRQMLGDLLHWLRSNWPNGVSHLEKEIDGNPPFAVVANDAVTKIDLDEESLDKSSINMLRALANAIAGLNEADTIPITLDEINKVIGIEVADHPETVAQQLAPRLPQFVLFSPEDRDLNSTYELSQFFGSPKQATIPKALLNLATAAELELDQLFLAMQQNNQGKIETIIDHANKAIHKKISAAWSQAKIEMRFRPDATRLNVIVRIENSSFDSISQRSDGLRQFIALVSFLSTRRQEERDIILLIDEIEIHLHYDAQADLVQMLAKQPFAKKVIFTTHSIGCLPEDLGMGIRLLETSGDTSTILNRFWSKKAGYSPLLFGMGAKTMAFIPVRYCVLTEGASDMILIPTLLKTATAKESLGFQISPALAETSPEYVQLLESEGSRTAYLVDGDPAGKEISKKLISGGVPNEKIVALKDILGKPCVIEDLLDVEIYVDAINDEIGRRKNVTARIGTNDISATMRPDALKSWCEKNGIDVPSKVDVAYRVLDRFSEGASLCTTNIQSLKTLDQTIRAIFEKMDATR